MTIDAGRDERIGGCVPVAGCPIAGAGAHTSGVDAWSRSCYSVNARWRWSAIVLPGKGGGDPNIVAQEANARCGSHSRTQNFWTGHGSERSPWRGVKARKERERFDDARFRMIA